jgi:hypothetical protein
MEPPPPPGPPLPVGPPGIEPPPPPGPPLPVGPPGTEPPPEVSPGTDDVGAGAVLVVELVVVVVVVLLLVEPPPPPHPTASASIATPPSSAIITLDSDFISYPLSACRATDTPGAGARNSRTVRGILTARNADSSTLPGGAWRTYRPGRDVARASRAGRIELRLSPMQFAQASVDRRMREATRRPDAVSPKTCRITNRQHAANMRNGCATR